jgi:hypothetical protein
MADLAAVYSAIKAKVSAEWHTTPVGFLNEVDPVSADANGVPAPWVLVEIANSTDQVRGMGKPGDNVWAADGFISFHVFVPLNTGSDLAVQYATALGELFRGQQFYASGPSVARAWGVRVSPGDSGSDDGNWFRVTSTVEWTFLYTK